MKALASLRFLWQRHVRDPRMRHTVMAPDPPQLFASPHASRPDWVNAASLQAALRGSSSAVPHLQVRGWNGTYLPLGAAIQPGCSRGCFASRI